MGWVIDVKWEKAEETAEQMTIDFHIDHPQYINKKAGFYTSYSKKNDPKYRGIYFGENPDLDRIYWDESGEHEVGNCALVTIMKMCEKGAYVHRMYYRGINFSPVWIVKATNPIIAVATRWFYWSDDTPSDRAGRYMTSEEIRKHGHGFNNVVFRRRDKTY